MSIQKSPAPPTTSPSSISDFLKPQYSEAVVRLKNSLLALLALFTLTHLLPTPALYTSAWRLYRRTHQSTLEMPDW
ncbi:hypothetical protein EWM64_g8874 [Hericium alpestre]|uniref:Uncharacterized protein n=1 Tax=Hericium alpestre TaxID=135208 RepID=A0A4Y9ZK13_9AGAM|nr:hypothetical protein EWM64_g8874 [Hericium alpestre]